MRVGVIGSGNVGGALIRRLREVGHEVMVANSRGPASLTLIGAETGATPASVESTAREGDLVFLAVPLCAVLDLPAAAFRDRLVVDVTNYYPERDGDIPELMRGGLTSSRWVAERLPGTRIVKAFNTIFADHLRTRGRPSGSPDRIGLPVASDDPDGKRLVSELVEQLGFDAVDGGDLAGSWRQQPGSPIYTTDRAAVQVEAYLGQARTR
ncbi:NADPH-dependent F420 reductase [Micromonospora sp. NPDC049559]|uniref:NADPH-dependent F420 reductase n=1 Tax=Micromonospora sp. NPDC049559 TaxID=3155923 RepID=UPI00342F9A33